MKEEVIDQGYIGILTVKGYKGNGNAIRPIWGISDSKEEIERLAELWKQRALENRGIEEEIKIVKVKIVKDEGDTNEKLP